MASDFAMSQPSFVPERREIWYSDGVAGFYVLRVDARVWPKDAVPAKACKSRRRFTVRVSAPKGSTRPRDARRQAAARHPPHGRASVDVRMNGLPRRAVQLVIRVKRRGGRVDHHTPHVSPLHAEEAVIHSGGRMAHLLDLRLLLLLPR